MGLLDLHFHQGKLNQKSQRNIVYWLVFYCILNLLSYIIQDHLPKVAPLTPTN